MKLDADSDIALRNAGMSLGTRKWYLGSLASTRSNLKEEEETINMQT